MEYIFNKKNKSENNEGKILDFFTFLLNLLYPIFVFSQKSEIYESTISEPIWKT